MLWAKRRFTLTYLSKLGRPLRRRRRGSPSRRSLGSRCHREQWAKLRDAVEHQLGPKLGWQILPTRSTSRNRAGAPSESELRRLVQQYPELALEALQKKDDLANDVVPQQVLELVRNVVKAAEKMDAGFIESYRRVVKSLPKQRKRAVEELGNLLQTWSLLQITHVASEVRQRLTTLKLFRERILDERTYEIIGEDSIHRNPRASDVAR